MRTKIQRCRRATLALSLFLTLPVVASGIDLPRPHLGGHLRWETFGYPDDERTGSDWENQFELVVRGGGKLSETVSYRFDGRSVADDSRYTAGAIDLRNSRLRRPYIDFNTAVVDVRAAEAFRVSVGKQVINWSGIDEIQPANLLVPYDETDIFRRAEQGIYAISARYGGENYFAEAVVVPLAFTLTRIPQGRWNIIPDSTRTSDNFLGMRPEVPPVRVEETQAALRLGAVVEDLDVSMIGYVGRDVFPIFVSNLIFVGGRDPFKIEILTRYPELRAGGFTMSHPLGEAVLLRSEVMYFSSPDPDRENFFQYVPLGAEYTYGDWFVVLNYARFDRTAAAREITDQGERTFFPSFLFGELRYDSGDRLRGRLNGGYDFDDEFVTAGMELTYRILGGLRIGLVANLIGAQKFSYFDRIRHEDRIGLRTEYYF